MDSIMLLVKVTTFSMIGLACIMGITSCKADTQEIDQRSVHGYDSVSLETVGRLEIIQGDKEYLTIEAPPEMVRRITTKVSKNTLRIGYKGIFTSKNAIPIFRLGMKNVKKIYADSSGDIAAEQIRTDNLTIKASSSGNITIKTLESNTAIIKVQSSGNVIIESCKLNKLDTELESSGSLDLAGETNRINVISSSSGKFNGENLKTLIAEVRLTSSGSAVIWIMNHLDANLTSKGDLQYYGDPVTGKQSTDGKGKIIKLGQKKS